MEINYGLIIITDILPFGVVLSILFYTYTVFGVLLYYLNIYSKRRWKRLTKKLKEIDNIFEMSLNLIERNASNDAFAVDENNVNEKEATESKEHGKKGRMLKKQLTTESDDKGPIDVVDENVTIKGIDQDKKKDLDSENAFVKHGNKSSHTQMNPSLNTSGSVTLATLAKGEETPFNESFEKSIDKIPSTQNDITRSTESMSFLKTSPSPCEPLKLYKDEHAQSMKLVLKQHKIIVNVSEIDDRIVIQTISQNVQDNSNFDWEMNGPNNIEIHNSAGVNADSINGTVPQAVRSKYDELVNEETHLQNEKEEELTISFILMLFFTTVTFLLLWLPSEVYNYKEMLADANLTRLVYQTTDVYEFNKRNVFNLFKSLNGIVLFIFFYCMYNNFKIHLKASLSRIFSSRNNANK